MAITWHDIITKYRIKNKQDKGIIAIVITIFGAIIIGLLCYEYPTFGSDIVCGNKFKNSSTKIISLQAEIAYEKPRIIIARHNSSMYVANSDDGRVYYIITDVNQYIEPGKTATIHVTLQITPPKGHIIIMETPSLPGYDKLSLVNRKVLYKAPFEGNKLAIHNNDDKTFLFIKGEPLIELYLIPVNAYSIVQCKNICDKN